MPGILPWKPSELCALVPSATSSLCDRIQKVFLRMPQMLCQAFSALFNEDGTPTENFVNAMQLIPTGMVCWRPSTIVPNGWLHCDGTEVSRTTFAQLFAVIGTTFGNGNGSTTFNLPNLQDKFLFGASATRAVGQTGGEEMVTLQTAQLPAHKHDVAILIPGHGGSDGNRDACDGGTNSTPLTNDVATYPSGAADAFGLPQATSKNAGSDQPHNNLPPFVCGRWLIKT